MGEQQQLREPIEGTTCYHLGQPGHWRRVCPQSQNASAPAAGQDVHHLKLNVVTWQTARPDTYMEVDIGGNQYKFHLNKGCDHSIITATRLQPTSVRVTIVNRTGLPIHSGSGSAGVFGTEPRRGGGPVGCRRRRRLGGYDWLLLQ